MAPSTRLARVIFATISRKFSTNFYKKSRRTHLVPPCSFFQYRLTKKRLRALITVCKRYPHPQFCSKNIRCKKCKYRKITSASARSALAKVAKTSASARIFWMLAFCRVKAQCASTGAFEARATFVFIFHVHLIRFSRKRSTPSSPASLGTIFDRDEKNDKILQKIFF